MTGDWRANAAKYYDLSPDMPNDIMFYRERLLAGRPKVLELGCGTGRVSVPLAQRASSFLGIDSSAAMAAICEERLREADLEQSAAAVQVDDITQLSGSNEYDFIVAPYRVMQNLETDEQVAGLLRAIHANLRVGGRAILNVFNPRYSPVEIVQAWSSEKETLSWTVETPDGRIECYERRKGVTVDPLVIYPDLIYRRFVQDELVDEALLSIAMRCYYPDEFLALISDAGFVICNTWGGYAGEKYGKGSELVVEFMSGMKY